MTNKKRKFALWASEEMFSMIEQKYKSDNCKSRSEFIEKAVGFYCGYLDTNGNEFLPKALLSSMRGMLDSSDDRMATLLFRLAVEICMMLHITAATNEIDEDTLTRLRGKCVEEVKSLRGRVSFDRAIKFQRGQQ